jgi:divinyl protochlorophyllide a 8-vinyl-reductase
MQPARIGPNAIVRVAEAVRAQASEEAAARLFLRAGLADYLTHPPHHMVDEREVAALHRALREAFDGEHARRLSRSAGERTGAYLLAHRIPWPVQVLLRLLPPPLAARMLLSAIRRHAWTFAGSGRFSATAGRPVRLTIAGNPLCRGEHAAEPVCAYYAASFERLFRALVHPQATVVETACEATGAPACQFLVRWQADSVRRRPAG